MGTNEPDIVSVELEVSQFLLAEEVHFLQYDVLRFVFVDGADMEVSVSDVVGRNDQVVLGLGQYWTQVELPATVSIWSSELNLEKHIINVIISTLCQYYDVTAMNEQLLDLWHIAWNLFLVLE